MRLRTLAPALLVVCLVALAGCSGSGGSQPYQTPLNSTQVEHHHQQALADAGSFTYHLTANTSFGENNSVSSDVTAKVDTNQGNFSVNTTSPFGRLTVYQYGNGTAYTRLQAGNRTQYVRGERSNYNVSQFTRLGVANATADVNFTYNGTTTIEGETVHEYVARQNQSLAAITGSNATSKSGNVTSVLRVYVRSDGLVKRFSYHVEQSGVGQATITGTYLKVGSTDVSPPTWVGDAKNQTSQ